MESDLLLEMLGQSGATTAQIGEMPQDTIRFSLTYAAVPDLEAERARLTKLLASAAFSLTRLEDDPELALAKSLILQFPGVSRTLSDRALYDIGQMLADRLGLVSCEPDIGARVFFEPDPRSQPITSPESSIVGLWCSSTASPPADRQWALDVIRAPKAWAISPARGAGVLVGQPDTGIATHSELESGLFELAKARNILEGGAPTDPLAPGMSNPGHGTATASAVASRQAGIIAGAAPGARVVPIRCVNSVVLFDAAPVAAAVNHARAQGCDVVTMSLGGIFSTPLQAAINDAVRAGMIVLAAAGNCVGFVTFPASERVVIAVAGVDVNGKPWKGTSRGSKVEISAPGENVYVAVRKPGDVDTAQVGASQGTSFAVALTAGVAALWLAHHGKTKVRAVALQRNISVNDLFRAALKQTAQRAGGWDTARYGAGIVDAEALLKLPLASIVLPTAATVKPKGTLEKVSTLASEGRSVDGFDWARHGAEATLLAAEAAITSRRALIGFEVVGRGLLRPSRDLALTAPPLLQKLFADEPPPRSRRATSGGNPQLGSVMKLLATSGTGLESTAAMSLERAQHKLRAGHGRDLIEGMEKTFSAQPEADDAISAERALVLKSAKTGLAKLAAGGAGARLSTHEIFAAEALVSLHNRPALRVKGDGFDLNDPMLGDWSATLFNSAALSQKIAAVGRINLDNAHVGTGWVIAPGLIATNRHVLEALAEEFSLATGGTKWVFDGTASINFDATGVGSAKSFKITELVSTGADRINGQVDFGHLDMAILAVETTNATGAALPAALPLIGNIDLAGAGSDILVCGFPARPDPNTLRDPDTGLLREDVVTRLQRIFGFAYSVKYLSPGQIQAGPGTLDGDVAKWVIGHDATTLGGNSGSIALFLGDPLGVVGLHFGGGTLRSNYAHALQAVRASSQLSSDALAQTVWI